MKKLFSIVLMTAGLLVSANAAVYNVSTAQQLTDNIATILAAGGENKIILDDDITIDGTINLLYGKTLAECKNVANYGSHLTIDLNGHILSNGSAWGPVFNIFNGTLEFAGAGKVESETSDVLQIRGYVDDLYSRPANAKTGYNDACKYVMWNAPTGPADYSKLIVGENVTIHMKKDGRQGGERVIYVDGVQSRVLKKVGYNTSVPKYYGFNDSLPYMGKYDNTTKSAGVQVVINGKLISNGNRCIQTNGNMRECQLKADSTKFDVARNLPTIWINKTARLEASDTLICTNVSKNTWESCPAIYGAGFAIWHIYGEVVGEIGVYAKSGSFDIKDAIITSNSTATEYINPQAAGSGTKGGSGSAIVFDSHASYSQEMTAVISGDTKVEGAAGFAIQETVTKGTDKLELSEIFEIQGGTFIGGEAGCIIITDEAKEITGVAGGSFTDTESIDDIIDGFTTLTEDKEGNPVFVVTTGKPAPTPKQDINDAADNSSVELDGTGKKELTADKTLSFLRMVGEGAGNGDTVIIPEGKKLSVGQLVMSADAQIIVRAGGTLIVTGDQGVVASYTDNIKLESQQGMMAKFLFSPAVKSNPNPKATVEFTSKSYYKSEADKLNQRMGLPMVGELEGITAKKGAANVPTVMSGYWNGSWTDSIVYINYSSKTTDLAKLNHPFIYYQMINFAQTPGTVVTMKGSLVGNNSPVLEIASGSYATFANSYLGDMPVDSMLKMVEKSAGDLRLAVWTYIATGADRWAWDPYTYIDVECGLISKVEPMQAFILRNLGSNAASIKLNYKDLVWDPATKPAAVAARRMQTNANFAKMSITDGKMVQGYVRVMEDDRFSAEFDNGYDAEKIMSNYVDLYVSADQAMSNFATDNLHNTFLGFNCAEAGEYTINFDKANGNGMVLVDLVKGTQIAMIEGNSYTFEAQANEANSHRFQIRKIAEQATAVENVEAAKAEGIYTIMGQYVGKNINVLPAGVYVVNGAKIVK